MAEEQPINAEETEVSHLHYFDHGVQPPEITPPNAEEESEYRRLEIFKSNDSSSIANHHCTCFLQE